MGEVNKKSLAEIGDLIELKTSNHPIVTATFYAKVLNVVYVPGDRYYYQIYTHDETLYPESSVVSVWTRRI